MVQTDLRNLGRPPLLFFFCLLVFLLLNQGNKKIFPKKKKWNGFFAIHSFFIKADKTLWNSHSVFVLLR